MPPPRTRLNQRTTNIALSMTLALDARAQELTAAGRDIVNMTAGQPDFPAPEAAQAAAERAVRGGNVRYTPASGRLSLRTAIAEELSATRCIDYEPQDVVVCHSAKHALSGAFLSLIEDGDEVLLLLPAWVSYDEQIRFAGGVPVGVRPRRDCGPDLDALRAAVTERTRGILLNSPCNPSGYVLTKAEVEAIVALCEEHDLWIVSDEIYQRLVYEGEPNVSPAAVGGRDRTLIIDGASKVFAMTGYRIGYAAGPRDIVAGIGRLHSQLTGCPNAISQDAYEAALRSNPPEPQTMSRAFDERRRVLVESLVQTGLHVPRPRGAFYVFADVEPYLDERRSAGFCEDLLEREGLALVPGSAFGMDEYVRFSYAVSMDLVHEAVVRLARFLEVRPEVRKDR
jgi:aspartate aminotransferase